MIEDKFGATLDLIKDKQRKISFYEKELRALFESELKEDFNQFMVQLNTYQNSYYQYLEILGKYENAEKITPLDAFPGIHTVKSVADIESMAKDSKVMEELANKIKQSETSLEKREGDLISNAKQISSLLSSLLTLHGEVQEAFKQIMEQTDSVYDVGFLSRTNV